MRKLLVALYSTLAYLFFLGTFLYAIGFIERIVVPRHIDTGEPTAGTLTAILVDLDLLGLFAIQHSMMARQSFKQMWTRIIPEQAERSTYVLAASLVLALLLWQWQPLPHVVWSVDGAAATLLTTAYILLGIWLEERDLVAHFGRRYDDYRQSVGMLLPRWR